MSLAVADSLRRAREWLRAAQHADGAWRDFWLPPGTSDEWVTGYVGAALALAGEPENATAAAAAWRFLESRQRPDGGWGYTAAWPADADSTTWALTLALRIGAEATPSARRGLDALRRFVVPGGIATYGRTAEIAERIGRAGATCEGWTQPHFCVTGAAARLPSFSQLLAPDISEAQNSDGSWRSYWWSETAYATLQCIEALAANPVAAGSSQQIGAAVGWTQRRLLEPRRGAFSEALLLSILRYGPADHPERVSCAQRLIGAQDSDGKWRGSAHLRVPAPEVADPESVVTWTRWWGSPAGSNMYSLDQRSIFTTATAASALHSVRHLVS